MNHASETAAVYAGDVHVYEKSAETHWELGRATFKAFRSE
jgi:hypothetical protein